MDPCKKLQRPQQISFNILQTLRKNNSPEPVEYEEIEVLTSATRSAIERSFALLKGRFRRLKFLDMEVKYIPATILACCVLYNICIDENNKDFLQEGLNKVDIVDEDDFTNYEPIERQRPEFLKRNRLAQNL